MNFSAVSLKLLEQAHPFVFPAGDELNVGAERAAAFAAFDDETRLNMRFVLS
jgi:hypothetical protein